MKNYKLPYFFLGLFLRCSVISAQPLPPDQVIFDEFGHATMNGTPMTCSFQPDPTPGGGSSVLFCQYNFTPGNLVTGDLVIYEPGLATVSDVIRVTSINIPSVGTVAGFFIYSDNDDGADAPADVGIPAIQTTFMNLVEVGPEGQNGVVYTPDYNQIGFFQGADEAIVYTFISDQLPPAISKAFGSSQLQLLGPGNTTTLTFTVNNPETGPFAETFTDTAFTDTLPAGLIISDPNGLSFPTCGGGPITAAANTNFIQLTAATLAPGDSCTFTLNVTASQNGVWTNITSAVNALSGQLVGNKAYANISVDAEFFLWFFSDASGGSRTKP